MDLREIDPTCEVSKEAPDSAPIDLKRARHERARVKFLGLMGGTGLSSVQCDQMLVQLRGLDPSLMGEQLVKNGEVDLLEHVRWLASFYARVVKAADEASARRPRLVPSTPASEPRGG